MDPIRPTIAALTIILVFGSAAPAWSWGDLGHKTICEMAFQELNEAARKAVRRLMKEDSEFRFFANACTWPDHPRKRASEHFVNVPRDFDRFTAPGCPVATACLLTAIRRRSPGPPHVERFGRPAGGAQVPGPLGRRPPSATPRLLRG